MRCWSCDGPLEGAADACPRCGKLQPPRARDYFEYLGLPKSFHVDLAKVDDVLREKSRKLHPDRFARADEREKSFSLQHTTFLNDAVRTLRDPQRRAEYLLTLHGLKAGANDRQNAKVDPAFLMEMMETRETLADAKASKDGATMKKIGGEAAGEKERLLSEAEAKFTQWEKTGERLLLEQVVSILDKVRYFEQIVAEAAGQPIGH